MTFRRRTMDEVAATYEMGEFGVRFDPSTSQLDHLMGDTDRMSPLFGISCFDSEQTSEAAIRSTSILRVHNSSIATYASKHEVHTHHRLRRSRGRYLCQCLRSQRHQPRTSSELQCCCCRRFSPTKGRNFGYRQTQRPSSAGHRQRGPGPSHCRATRRYVSYGGPAHLRRCRWVSSAVDSIAHIFLLRFVFS